MPPATGQRAPASEIMIVMTGPMLGEAFRRLVTLLVFKTSGTCVRVRRVRFPSASARPRASAALQHCPGRL